MDKSIVEFLIRAKKATYAGKGATTAPSRQDSHDLQYAEGPLSYLDTYLGELKFAGEEALWKDGIPFWAMNYAGRVTGDGFSGDFLKEALSLVPKEYPYRGPLHHQNGDYSYTCSVTGDFDWFHGTEEISFKGVKIYELLFHGGAIEDSPTG